MNAVAICFGIAAATTVVVSARGPDKTAGWISVYLMASWIISNSIFLSHDPETTLEYFAWMDAIAGGFITILWFAYPRVWLGILVASLDTQLAFNALHHADIWRFGDILNAYLVNDVLFGIQLFSVHIPWFSTRKRRVSPVKVRKRPRKRAESTEIKLVWDREAA